MSSEYVFRKGLISIGSTTNPPIKLFRGGSYLTTPENGAIEYFAVTDSTTDDIPCFTTKDRRHIIDISLVDTGAIDSTFSNTTTLGNILTISLGSSTLYQVELFCNITATTSFGMKGAMTISTTPSKISTYSNLFSGTSIISGTRTDGTSFGATEFSSTTTTSASFLLKGTIFTATACTITFQGAQASSGASTTTFQKGSYLKATPIYVTPSF